MDKRHLLTSLEETVTRLGIEVQSVRGDAPSGLCRLGNRQVLMWNAALTAGQQVSVLCRELARLDLSRVFIVPAVRERLEGQAARRP